MKTIPKDWPKLRLYVKGGNKYYRVDLRRKHHLRPQAKDFNDREKALKHAATIAEQVTKLGVNSLAVVNDPLSGRGQKYAPFISRYRRPLHHLGQF
jgi:hypothetical protein